MSKENTNEKSNAEQLQTENIELKEIKFEEYVEKSIAVAVLVAGLEDFSSWLDFLKPEEVSDVLNRYFEAIGKPVEFYGGYIDKYMGDGFITIFGLRPDLFGHPSAFATLAALDILDNVKKFNQFLFKKYGREFSMGIGIDYGNIILGNIGFRNHKEITAIGRPVSRARSIEKLTRSIDSSILVSGDAQKVIEPLFHWGEKFKAKLKKENRSINVVQPIALTKRRYQNSLEIEEY